MQYDHGFGEGGNDNNLSAGDVFASDTTRDGGGRYSISDTTSPTKAKSDNCSTWN